jgi:threonine synthase
MKIFCSECHTQGELKASKWRCDCGGAWEIEERTDFDAGQIDRLDASLWRYRHLFGFDMLVEPVRLGAGWTPLLPAEIDGREILLKLEYIAPSGSFKDRGTEMMMSMLVAQGATRVVDDSSGNAGASVAAYAARAGIRADIYVPSHASPAKRAQIAAYGAEVHPIPGPRAQATQAAISAVEGGLIAAFHAYHPGFLLGQQSVGWEIWEQMGERLPDWYVLPVGQGIHLLGVWLAFRRLLASRRGSRLPHLVAVQAAALAPIRQALAAGLESVPEVTPNGTSIAEGIAIAHPVRGRRIMEAIRESEGLSVVVKDDDILAAQQRMAHIGFFIEPTSAAAVAALDVVAGLADVQETVVVPLTGSGLKGAPQIP